MIDLVIAELEAAGWYMDHRGEVQHHPAWPWAYFSVAVANAVKSAVIRRWRALRREREIAEESRARARAAEGEQIDFHFDGYEAGELK